MGKSYNLYWINRKGGALVYIQACGEVVYR